MPRTPGKTPPRVAPKGCVPIATCFEKQLQSQQQSELTNCPNCGRRVKMMTVNRHLDVCLGLVAIFPSKSENPASQDADLEKSSQILAPKTRKRRKNAGDKPSKKRVGTNREKSVEKQDTGSWKGPETDVLDEGDSGLGDFQVDNCGVSNNTTKLDKDAEISYVTPTKMTVPESSEKIASETTPNVKNLLSVASTSNSTQLHSRSAWRNGEDSGVYKSASYSQPRRLLKLKRQLKFNGEKVVAANANTLRLLKAKKLPACIASFFYGVNWSVMVPCETQSISQEPEDEAALVTYSPSKIDDLLNVMKAVLDEPDEEALFNNEDMDLLKIFYALPESALKLYVRLFQRKLRWFKLQELKDKKYCENLEEALAALHRDGFLMNTEKLADLETALDLFAVQTLKKYCLKTLLIPSGGKKGEVIAQILNHIREQRSVHQNGVPLEEIVLNQVKKELGECYHLSLALRDVLQRILTLYNLTAVEDNDDSLESQSPLTKIVLVSSGKFTFPDYTINKQKRIYRNREDFLRFVEANALDNEIAGQMQEKAWNKALVLSDSAVKKFKNILEDVHIASHVVSLPLFLRRFTAGHIYARCLYRRVEIFQKMKVYINAVEQLEELLGQEVYCQGYRGVWYDRLALNLDQHLQKKDEAMKIVVRGLLDDRTNPGFILVLCNRGDRLQQVIKDSEIKESYSKHRPRMEHMKRKQITIVGRKIPGNIPGYKSAFVGKYAMVNVEKFAQEHYEELGYTEGIHGEGSTVVSIFGLLMWDIVYSMDVADVFRTPHQIVPLDLHTDEFYLGRREDIDERVKFISTATIDELLDEIQDIWEKHKGKNSLVNWQLFGNVETVTSLVRCIGCKCLTNICEKLAGDFRNCRGGVPDLVVWNPNDLSWMMVEVKGPGDTLSVKQTMWIDFLTRIKVKVEVCNVTDKVSKRLEKMPQ